MAFSVESIPGLTYSTASYVPKEEKRFITVTAENEYF